MKRIMLICLLFISVEVCSEEIFFAEDFANQSVLLVQNDRQSKQCQAVRILPKWYLTAAHCVSPYCNKECRLEVQLLNGPLQASAEVRHTAASAHVFVPASYYPGKMKSIRYDLALVRFDPSEEDYSFYEARSKQYLDKSAFIKLLNSSNYANQRVQWQALENPRPVLLSVNNSFDRHVSAPLAVPDLRSGEILFKQSAENSFYYFTQLRHYVGPNFGVERGMSGGGVVLPGGVLIGIVSGNISNFGEIMIYNEKDEPVKKVPYSSDYFLFTPFSQDNSAFIRATVNSFRESRQSPNIVPVNAHYAPQTQDKLQDVFAAISSKDGLADVKRVE